MYAIHPLRTSGVLGDNGEKNRVKIHLGKARTGMRGRENVTAAVQRPVLVEEKNATTAPEGA